MRRIAIATYSVGAYSETFVRAHIEHLSGEIHVLHGGYFPTRFGKDERLLRPYFLKRGLQELLVRATGRVPRWCSQEGALISYLKRHRIDAVVAEFGQIGAKILSSCIDAGVPLIVYFRGYDAYTFRDKEYAHLRLPELYPALMKNATAFVAVSHDIRARLIELGAPPERIHYNTGGANLELFTESLPGDAPPTFITVGRFTEKKAPHLALLAFNGLLKAVPEARLVMVGEGLLLGPCVAMAEALRISDSVDFLGAQSHQRVEELMRSVRGFVQHSIQAADGDSEGTPISVMEAQAAGLPVVSTRHAGIKDVVVEGETGFLVDECDTEDMTEKLIRLARDPSLAARMGAAGRTRARQHFSMAASNEELSRLIDQVIRDRNAPAEVPSGHTAR
jgi:colanic acid/amylovoran biosynthesis glycosyltransferase